MLQVHCGDHSTVQPLSSPVLGVFEVKLDKDNHGLGITIAGYTDQTGLFSSLP